VPYGTGFSSAGFAWEKSRQPIDANHLPKQRLPAASAASTTTVAASTTTVAATTTATATVLTRTRFVDAQGATTHVRAVESGDGLGGIIIVHLDEPEATGALGLAVERNGHGDDFAMDFKQLPKLIFGRAKGHVSNINLLSQRLTLTSRLMPTLTPAPIEFGGSPSLRAQEDACERRALRGNLRGRDSVASKDRVPGYVADECFSAVEVSLRAHLRRRTQNTRPP